MSRARTGGPIHLYQAPVLACGVLTTDSKRGLDKRFVLEVKQASCKRCAKRARDLTDEQRIDIWQNANDRLGQHSDSPWEIARRRKEREEARIRKAVRSANGGERKRSSQLPLGKKSRQKSRPRAAQQ